MRRADGPLAAVEQPGEGRALPAQRRGARRLDAASQIVLHIQLLPAMPSPPTAPARMRADQAVQAHVSEAPQAALPVAVGTQTAEHAGLESHMLVADDSSTPLSKEELDEHVHNEDELQKEELVAGSDGARVLEVQVCRRSLWYLLLPSLRGISMSRRIKFFWITLRLFDIIVSRCAVLQQRVSSSSDQ
jgi:hypothetical protein